MTEYNISEHAYAKMVFHAAKYPYSAVNGILLAEQQSEGGVVRITDAIPLFHQCLYLTPMLEIALPQIEAYAEQQSWVVAGYYAAAELITDNTIEKMPATKIADKILEHNEKACFIILDNNLINVSQQRPAVVVYTNQTENNVRWTKTKYTLAHTQTTLETVSALLRRGAMRDLIDFDNHLDQPENDWTNQYLNRDLQQIMAMY